MFDVLAMEWRKQKAVEQQIMNYEVTDHIGSYTELARRLDQSKIHPTSKRSQVRHTCV
jgi:TorA maturation chaperone TorD